MDSIDERVSAAAEQLLITGQKVTIPKVRKVLGGGSYTIIGPAVSRWKTVQIAADSSMLDVPDEINKFHGRHMALIWREALRIARGDADAFRLQAESRRQELQDELDSAIAELSSLENDRDELRKKVTEQGEELANAHIAGRSITLEVERLRVENQRERQATLDVFSKISNIKAELSAAIALNKKLEDEKSNLYAALETARADAAELRGRMASINAT